MRKCLVIGLDGATWDVLNPLIKSGHIPTLKKLMRKGVWGVLESTIPPYTGVAWTSFTTGCNAGKHGVFDFIKFDGKSHKMTVIKSDDVKAKTYFKYLEDKGYRNIIINLPGGFPPTDFSGIFVADFLAPDEKDIVRPKKLKLKYKEFKDYRIALKSHMFDHSRYLDEVLGIEEKRFLLAKKLFLKEKWDHFFLLFSGTDWASHSALGHFFSKKGSIRDKFIKLFVKIDSYIKWFSENMDEDTDLIIISDHGQTQKRKIFFMNEWLRRHNYAASKPQERDPFLKRESERSELKEKGLGRVITRLSRLLMTTPARTPLAFIHRVLREKAGISLVLKSYSLDKEHSSAFCPAFSTFGVYMNSKERFWPGKLTKKETGDLRDRIIKELSALRDPKDNSRIFKNVWKREDVYSGPFVKDAPDILFLPENGIEIHTDTNVPSIISKDTHYSGCHTMDGIFMAYGPDFRGGKRLTRLRILDIAPTILRIFNITAPRYMDGKAIKG